MSSRILALIAMATMVSMLFASLAQSGQPGENTTNGKEPRNPRVAALVRVHKVKPSVLEEKAAKFDKVEFADYLRTQVMWLRSRMIVNAALRAKDVADLASVKEQKEPAEWLEKRLQITADEKTGIIRIEVTGGPAEERALLANALMAAYFTECVEKEHAGRLGRLELLKELYARYELELRKKRKDLRTLENDIGGDGKLMKLKQEFALKELTHMQNELLHAQSQLRKIQLNLEMIKAKQKAGISDASIDPRAIEEALGKHSGVAQLTAEISNLETTMTVIRKLIAEPEKDQTYLKTRDRLGVAKKELGDLREQLTGTITKQVRERVQTNLEADRSGAENQIAFLRKLADLLTKEIDDRQRSFVGLNKRSIELEWLKDEIDLHDETRQKIGRQIQSLLIEIQAPRRVIMIDQAVAPSK